jgi:anthranilate phosphoribosyltransferase
MDAIINRLESGHELQSDEINLVADLLLDESVSANKKAQFLKALSQKGETPTEITGFVEAFLRHAVDPKIGLLGLTGPSIDVCGTGGDKLNLFNVSTSSMFVIAAGGAVVVKHGNRGITSKSGGADVLEALGIKLDASPSQLRQCLKEAGVGFLFAPVYHPSFKVVAPVRQILAQEGIRTIFNLIGPLLNPARPTCQLVGISQPNLRNTYADILARLGRTSAWIVQGHTTDGRLVDELSLMGTTEVSKIGAFHPKRGDHTGKVRPEAMRSRGTFRQ